MQEDDARIDRVSSVVGGAVFIVSLIAIPVIGLFSANFTNPNSGLRLAAKVIVPIWSVAFYRFGVTIPYDITRSLMQILSSHYWAATFRKNWKP